MNDPWWRGAVLYEIYIRSFNDTDGDGIGDLNGIRERIDYLAHLGIDIIWITPFFKSPMRDFGYDVSDYYSIDPRFGDFDEFRQLLEHAHKKGLKVIIDQVWSHSSSDHAWFTESRSSKDNPKADWYVWADAKPDGTPPNNWLSLFGGSAWTWDTRRRQYYLHNFLSEQPDINFHNAEVQSAILDVARFWFEIGVDGFRLDVCNLYFHDQALSDNPIHEPGYISPNPHNWQFHRHCRSRPENLDFLKQLRQLADEFGDRILLGEIIDDGGSDVLLDYTQGDDRLHMAYSFDFLRESHNAEFFENILSAFFDRERGWPCWAIGNHDSIRVASRWGSDPRQLRLFAALQMCLRGNPCIYQGEELGLPQATIPFERIVDPVGITMWPDDPGRDGCRTPMPWDSSVPGSGFTQSKEAWLPIPDQHVQLNAERQLDDPKSLFVYYRKLLSWRSSQPTLKFGSLTLKGSAENLLIFERTHGQELMQCIFNLSDDEVFIETGGANYELVSGDLCTDITREGNSLRLGPWAFSLLKGA